MSVFAIVRDAADLAAACRRLGELLSQGRQRSPERPTERLLGIWVDAALAADVPAVMSVAGSIPVQQLRIIESTGLDGVWTLCRCESLGPVSTVSRELLVQALTAASERDGHGVFIPVFGADAPPAQVRGELERLRNAGPGRIGAPLFQDPASGALAPACSRRLPDAHRSPPGDRLR